MKPAGGGGTLRLDRLLAERGQGSRSVVTALVRQGRVQVDGKVCRDSGQHVGPGAEISVDGQPVALPRRVAAWHKPTGILSVSGDPWGRPGIQPIVTLLHGIGWHPVGRLDLETSGLLLFSRDGALTQRLLHPRRALEREYVATVEGRPDEALTQALRQGVETADGVVTARVLAIDGSSVRLVVTEGRYRMVRRMLANARFPVVALHRVRYGAVEIGDLQPNTWRYVEDDVIARLDAGPPSGPG